jgi:hypothetical protein
MRNASALLLIMQAHLRAEQSLHHNLTLDAESKIVSWLPPPAGAAFSAFPVHIGSH